MMQFSKFTQLGGVAIAIVGLMSTGAVWETTASASPKPVVVNCETKGKVKPKIIALACADEGIFVNKIKWTKWTSKTAKGTGTLRINSCLPKDCADGIIETYLVKITLRKPVPVLNAADSFTRMTLAFSEGSPAGADWSTYILTP
jgi:hypothetical protein